MFISQFRPGCKERAMTIPSINGPGRVSTATATMAAAIAAARQAKPGPVVEIDAQTQLPVPPRFPWLSRLSQQLETASGKRPSFPAAPVLGDHVDRAA
jgi:hypothetical protein